MDGYQKAIQRGLTTAESSLDELYREPTLDEARAEFSRAREKVKAMHDHLHETFDPEVFAFRSRTLVVVCGELERAAISLCHQAEKAARK